MDHPQVSNEDMHQRIMRWAYLKHQGIPVMFIDSPLERHQRINCAVIGDTTSENPEFKPAIQVLHKFQIGIMAAPQLLGAAYHTHDDVKMFLVLRGWWRSYWGYEPDGEPMSEAIVGKWDQITLPPGLYRGFESLEELSVTHAVLEPHQAFTGKDPIGPTMWSSRPRPPVFRPMSAERWSSPNMTRRCATNSKRNSSRWC